MIRHYLHAKTVVVIFVALLASCGGSTLSGGSNGIVGKKKERAASDDNEAKDPQVVTGAYLTCETVPKESSDPTTDAVGCSVILNGKNVKPTPINKLAFYRRFNDGAMQKPSQSNTDSGHQALFVYPKSETDKSRFLATYANRYGIDEVVCETLPCRRPVNLGPTPSFIQLNVDAVWRVDKGLTGAMDFFNFVDTRNYCDNGKIRLGSSPAGNSVPVVDIIQQISGSTKIEALGQLYAEISRFSKSALRSGEFYKSGNGCIILPLRRKGEEFFADEMRMQGPKINTELFHLILRDTPENKVTVRDFIDDLSQ
jgi:hypothetical protein